MDATDQQPTDDQKVTSNQPEPSAGQPIANPVVSTAPEHKPKKSGLILLLVIIVLVAGGAGAAWQLLSKDKTKQPASAAKTVVKKEVPNLKLSIFYVSGLDTPVADGLSYPEILYLRLATHESLVLRRDQTQLKPWLATEWTNPDKTKWDFTIAKGHEFHTGKPVTAAAVKASLDTVRASDNSSAYTGTITGVKVLAENKIEITTDQPDAALLSKLASVPIYVTTAPADQVWNSGSGAYKVKPGTKPVEGTLELVADDNFALGKPTVRSISIIGYTDYDKQNAAVSAKDIDVMWNGAFKPEAFPASKGYTVNSLKSSGAYVFELRNAPGSVFANKSVRQAIATLLDRDKIIQVDTTNPGAPASQLIPEQLPGYNKSIAAVKPDASTALKLLQAGGIPAWNKLTVRIGYIVGGQDLPTDEVVRQMEAVGIKVIRVKYTTDQGNQFFGDVDAGKFDMMSLAYNSDISDLSDVAQQAASPSSPYALYKMAGLDSRLAEANANFDPAKRASLLQSINKDIIEDYGVLPVRYTLYPYLIKSKYAYGNDMLNVVFPGYLWEIYEK